MAWITPITDRTQSDVDDLKALGKAISDIGWDNATQIQRVKWLLGETIQLFASDGVLVPTDYDGFQVGTGEIKGAVNPWDLNRIQGNIVHLRDWLSSDYGISIIIDESNPLWNRTLTPLLSNINTIRDNVKALVDGSYKFTSNPIIEYSDNPNWDDINDIEKNLDILYGILENIPLGYVYCGSFSCGQDGVL